jgi:hypothetical protein
MEELKKISKIVLKILQEDELARKDDMHLFLRVHETLIPNVCNYNTKVVLDLIRKKKLPSWESMSRARRKVQEKHPELRDEIVSNFRYAEEEKYKEFARC